MRFQSRFPHFVIALTLSIYATIAFAERGDDDSLQMKLTQATQLALADSRDVARDLLESIADEYPDSPEAYNNLAVLAAYSEDWKGAIELLNKALQTNKSLHTSYRNLNLIYRYRAALAYRAALPDDDQSPLPLPDLTMVNTTQSATPQTASPAVTEVIDAEPNAADIHATIENWAGAWSAKDVDRYLSSYINNYTPNDGSDNKTWRAVRRQRILAPASINVSLGNANIELLSNNKALVTFVQHYQSNVFSDSVQKLMVLRRDGQTWAIEREHVIR